MSSLLPDLSEARARWFHVAAVSLLLTLLNCIKPMHIDDSFYFESAAQTARAPLDPYGFEILWFQHPQPAITFPTPPVLQYFLAPVVARFSAQPWLLKLSLFPFSLLLTLSVDTLLRRFALRFAVPLLWMIVLSPAILPSMNLMLDVPALALSLASLACFARATDRLSWSTAAVAGLLAGLAIQTKYTGLTAPVAILLYGLIFDRLRHALLATIIAVGIFAGFELFTISVYGESHFLAALANNGTPWRAKFKLIGALVRVLGTTHAAGALLGLLILRWPPRRVAGLAIVLLFGLLGIALLQGEESNGLANVIFGATGIVVLGTILHAAFHHCGRRWRLTRWRSRWSTQQDDWFLLAWFSLELAAYVVLSPFSAVRRVLSLFVVGTIIVGRRASRIDAQLIAPRHVQIVATASVLLALLFQFVDWHEANAVRLAVRCTHDIVQQRAADESSTTWYVGHWGFLYYAQQAGWKQVVPNVSRLRPGDWLVKPTERLGQQQLDLDAAPLQPVDRVTVSDDIPWQTMANYYAGRRPLEGHHGPRLSVDLYRVTDPFVAQEPAGYESTAYAADRRLQTR